VARLNGQGRGPAARAGGPGHPLWHARALCQSLTEGCDLRGDVACDWVMLLRLGCWSCCWAVAWGCGPAPAATARASGRRRCRAAELATSSWTRAELEAWWAALRRHAAVGGDHLICPRRCCRPRPRAPGSRGACPTCAPARGGAGGAGCGATRCAGTACTCRRAATNHGACTCRGS
jgi:hypothetical protein